MGHDINVSFRMFAWEQAFGTKPPAKLFPSCGDGLCANPAHLTTERPKVIGATRFIMRNPPDLRKRKTPTYNDVAGSPGVPMQAPMPRAPIAKAPPPMPAPAPHAPLASVTPTSALADVARILDTLDASGRERVIAAVRAFYLEAGAA